MKTWEQTGDGYRPDWFDADLFDYEMPNLSGYVVLEASFFTVYMAPQVFAGEVVAVRSSSDVAGHPIFGVTVYPAELTDAGWKIMGVER